VRPLEVTETLLQWVGATSARRWRLSSEAAENGFALAQAYEALSPDERELVRETLTESESKKLLGLAAILAETAIDNRDPAWIRVALIVHIIENLREDYREHIRYLIFSAYAAEQLHLDLGESIRSVLVLASDRAAARLQEFARRDPALNQLASFGIREVKVDGKSRFVPA